MTWAGKGSGALLRRLSRLGGRLRRLPRDGAGRDRRGLQRPRGGRRAVDPTLEFLASRGEVTGLDMDPAVRDNPSLARATARPAPAALGRIAPAELAA